jgi:hypothetical protein
MRTVLLDPNSCGSLLEFNPTLSRESEPNLLQSIFRTPLNGALGCIHSRDCFARAPHVCARTPSTRAHVANNSITRLCVSSVYTEQHVLTALVLALRAVSAVCVWCV